MLSRRSGGIVISVVCSLHYFCRRPPTLSSLSSFVVRRLYHRRRPLTVSLSTLSSLFLSPLDPSVAITSLTPAIFLLLFYRPMPCHHQWHHPCPPQQPKTIPSMRRRGSNCCRRRHLTPSLSPPPLAHPPGLGLTLECSHWLYDRQGLGLTIEGGGNYTIPLPAGLQQ